MGFALLGSACILIRMNEPRNFSPGEEDLIGVTEAARILHVSADTARRYADKGLIPSTRTLTNQRRFSRSQLEGIRPRVMSA